MTDPRAEIFTAFRKAKPSVFNDPGNVLALDNMLDAFGVPRADTTRRRISVYGLALIKQFEGCRLTAYKDPVGVLTIGYGHTGPDVTPGMTITQDQADELLRKDVARFEKAVAGMAKVATESQFDALVSFAYNLGEEALRRSTLLRKHNEGDYAGAQTEFARWVNAGGKKLNGLVRRRAEEAALYGRAG